MKKVGVLTTHASLNFGGMLQAYAIKESIRKIGHQCDIINYVPDMQNSKKNPIQFVTKRKGFVSKAMLAVAHYDAYRNRSERISKFRSGYLSPQPEQSVGYAGLSEEVDRYDVVCTGSDQLWNLNLKDMENGAYMLNFPYETKSIAYSISFGDGLLKKRSEIIENLDNIRRFSHISVREADGYEFLKEQGIDSQITLDPTLLLDQQEWLKMAGQKPLIDQPYIFLYGFDSAYQRVQDLVTAAGNLSEKMGIPVVNALMTPQLARAGFLNVYRCGPREFLNLIRHSAYVCTNSFHATVFSYMFERPFSVIQSPGMGMDGRKKTLLELFDLTDRFMFPDDDVDADVLMDCSFKKMTDKLQERKEHSVNYLKNAIGD